MCNYSTVVLFQNCDLWAQLLGLIFWWPQNQLHGKNKNWNEKQKNGHVPGIDTQHHPTLCHLKFSRGLLKVRFIATSYFLNWYTLKASLSTDSSSCRHVVFLVLYYLTFASWFFSDHLLQLLLSCLLKNPEPWSHKAIRATSSHASSGTCGKGT